MIVKALVSIIALVGTLASIHPTVAHADLASSNPSADSTVTSAPLTLDLTFTEEVSSDGLSVRVVGPAGDEVQAGTAELDLNDPERRHVTVSLQANLPPGRYTVEWAATSSLDDHGETGSFAFTVAGASATPIATPVSGGSPIATPDAVASSVQAIPTLDPGANGNPLAIEEGDYDGRAFALSVGAGLIGVAAIALTWRAVRPRNPVFSGRGRG